MLVIIAVDVREFATKRKFAMEHQFIFKTHAKFTVEGPIVQTSMRPLKTQLSPRDITILA